MIARKSPVILLLFFITFLASIVSADLFGTAEKKTVWDVLTTDKRFSVLIGQIEEHDLASTFKGIKSETLFAPTDKAFDGDESSILKRKMTKEQVLYHLIPVSIKSNELWNGRLLDTRAYLHDVHQVLKVTKTNSEVLVGVGGDQEQSKISQANIEASNGVIHAIDKVISLPVYLDGTLYINQDTRDFYNKSEKAHITQDLKKAVGNTIFVAKGDAFGDQLTPFERKYLLEQKEGRKDLARLLNHQIATKIFYSDDFKEGKSTIKTVEGSEDLEVHVVTHQAAPPTITVNGIKVIQSDLIAANGVIHVLDSPLLPKNKNFLGLTARKALIGMNSTRFVELFDENDLGAYLDDQNDVTTILAPPDDAFDKFEFPPSKKHMASWLKYHIVHGRYDTSDLQEHQLLETASHDSLGDEKYQRLDVHVNDDHGVRKKSIRFGRSGVLDDPVPIGDNLIIYPIANPLVLPRDTLGRLPVNLELSTFVASLYASGAEESVQKAHGITLFAPTNEAFSRLGLLAKYLLQPDAKEKLHKVVTYHAVRGLFYENSTSEGEHRETTLSSGSEINLNKTEDGFFVRGSGAVDGNDRNVIAQVVKSDILTSNGVIHTVDRVQLPKSVEITNRDLLSVEGTNSFLNLLERADLAKEVLDDLDSDKPYTILAPSDRAFSKHNLTELLSNRDRLLKIAKLHILPSVLPRLDMGEIGNEFGIFGIKKNEQDSGPNENIGFTGVDFPTLLSKDSYVTISKDVSGGYSLKVKGDLTSDSKVINLGRSSYNGGVIEIDNVLLPKEESTVHGWRWWAIALLVIGILLGLALLAVAIYLGWRWYKSRRDGRIALGEENI